MRGITDARKGVLTLSVSALLLYLILAGTVNTFEIVTGITSALIVGILFTNVAFKRPPAIRKTPVRIARCVLFVPYLFWEIVKANITMAYLILHPSLPITPRFKSYETPDKQMLELSALATSITLTPGTLVSDISNDAFEIHALTDDAWDGLLVGTIERAVGFIFAGRSAFSEREPRERMSAGRTDPGTTDE